MAHENPAIAAATQAAVSAVVDTAAKHTNNIPSKSVDDATPELTRAIEKAIAASPEVQHTTNTEPWYLKRSRWSAIIGVVVVVASPLLTHFGLNLDPSTKDFIVTAATSVGGLVAAYLAYRAGTATTPLGVAPTVVPQKT